MAAQDELILDESSRTKLDGIVGEMQKNNEPDENIRFVVSDFKTKYGKKSEQPKKEADVATVTVDENNSIVPKQDQEFDINNPTKVEGVINMPKGGEAGIQQEVYQDKAREYIKNAKTEIRSAAMSVDFGSTQNGFDQPSVPNNPQQLDDYAKGVHYLANPEEQEGSQVSLTDEQKGEIGAYAEKVAAITPAIQKSIKSLEKNPDDINELNTLGDGFINLEDNASALSAYSKAIGISPNWKSFQGLGATYYQLGDIENAKKAFTESYDMNQDEPLPLSNLANIDINTGELEAAQKKVDEMKAKFPDYSVSYGLSARLKAAKGDIKGAEVDNQLEELRNWYENMPDVPTFEEIHAEEQKAAERLKGISDAVHAVIEFIPQRFAIGPAEGVVVGAERFAKGAKGLDTGGSASDVLDMANGVVEVMFSGGMGMAPMANAKFLVAETVAPHLVEAVMKPLDIGMKLLSMDKKELTQNQQGMVDLGNALASIVLLGAVHGKGEKFSPKEIEKINKLVKAAQGKDNLKLIETFNSMQSSTFQKAKEILGNSTLSEITRAATSYNSIPKDISDAVKMEVFPDVIEIERLEAEKKNSAPAFHPYIDKKIEALSAKVDAQLNEIVGKAEGAPVKAEEVAPNVGTKSDFEKESSAPAEKIKGENDAIDVTNEVVEKIPTEVKSENNIINSDGIKKNTQSEVDRVKSLPLESEDGATFNLDGTPHGEGLVIPIESFNTTRSELTPQMISEFVEKHKSKISGNNFKVGIYKFPNSEQVSIDFSLVVDPKHQKAGLEFGKFSGQESMYDLGTGKNIKTGADGKNPKSFTDSEFLEIAKSLEKGELPEIAKGKEAEAVTEKVKVYRGRGKNVSEGENDGVTWVAEDKKVAENYSKDGSVEEIEISKPKNPFPNPTDTIHVKGSDVGNKLRLVRDRLFKEGKLTKEQALEASRLIDEFELAAGENSELYSTKTNKKGVSSKYVKALQALGFDGIVQKESYNSGSPFTATKTGNETNTYGIFKEEPNPVQEKVETPIIIEPKDGDTVSMPARVQGGMEQKFVFSDGEWKQQVGRETSAIGKPLQEKVAAKFGEENSKETTPVVEKKEPVKSVEKTEPAAEEKVDTPTEEKKEVKEDKKIIDQEKLKSEVSVAFDSVKKFLKGNVPEGTKINGLSSDRFVDMVVKVIHSAIDAGASLEDAIRKGISHAKGRWDSKHGKFPEKEFADLINNKEVKPKATKKTDLVKDSYYEPNLTDDGNGNYVFFHVSNADVKSLKKGIDSRKFNSTRTDRTEKGTQYGVGSFYTKATDGERMVGGDKYAVTVPKDKVYPMDTDPNNYREIAEKKVKKDAPFREEKVKKEMASLAEKDGYEMAVGEWYYDRGGVKVEEPQLRADALKPLKPTEYTGEEGFIPATKKNIPHPEEKTVAAKREFQSVAQEIVDKKSAKGEFDEAHDIAKSIAESGKVDVDPLDYTKGKREVTIEDIKIISEGLSKKQKESLDASISKIKNAKKKEAASAALNKVRNSKLFKNYAPEGTKKSGMDINKIIDEAEKIIHDAIDAKDKIEAAIKKGIEHIKSNWDSSKGEFPEKDIEKFFTDSINKSERAERVGEKESLEQLTSYIPNNKSVENYLSGDTIEKYEGERPRNEQEYIKQELVPALEHGVKIIEAAKEKFGNEYVEKTLEYIENGNQKVASKALMYVSLENELAKRKILEPENDLAISKLQDLVRAKSQAYLRANSIEINMGRLRKIGEVGYDLSKVTDNFFSSAELEGRKKVEKSIQADGDAINKAADKIESGSIENLISEGVEKELKTLYEKLPTERRKKADKAIAALENIQKKLRNKTYDASIGIPVAIIDAGISTIKAAIRAGVEIADAIELGIAKIKKMHGKDWDKEQEFRKDMTDGFTSEGVSVKKSKTDAEKLEDRKNNIRKKIEDLKTQIAEKKTELKSTERVSDPELVLLEKQAAALKKEASKYLTEESRDLLDARKEKAIKTKLENEIAALDKQIIEGQKAERAEKRDPINSDEIASLKAQREAAKAILESIDPTPIDFIKEALIENGFGRETKVNGEVKTVLDWKKLAGEEGSVEKIRQYVETALEKKGLSEGAISRMQDAFVGEYNNLRASVIEKSLNELNRENKPKNPINTKGYAKRLAELFNMGLFDKQPDTYDYLMNKALGMSELSQANFFEAKKLAKALSKLYSTRATENGRTVNQIGLKEATRTINKEIENLLSKIAWEQSTKGFKIATAVKEYMGMSQRAMLNSVKQLIENPVSGYIQRAFTDLGYSFDKVDTKALRANRTKLAKAIYNDIVRNGALPYGDISTPYITRSKVEDWLNKQSDSQVYHTITSAILGRAYLDGADSMHKAALTDRYFTYNLVKVLEAKGMSKKEAVDYVSEQLTGENLVDARKKAKDIIEEVNESAGIEVLKNTKENIERMANNLVKDALLNGEKLKIEEIDAAYESAYTGAGYDLGHESNNVISEAVSRTTATIEIKIKQAIKEKKWAEAASLTCVSILTKNIINPFVGGGTNWMFLTMQKAGLDVFSLKRDYARKSDNKIDVTTEAGMKDLEKALEASIRFKNTKNRVVIGAMASLITYAALKGTGSDEDINSWLKKNEYARKYFNVISPQALVLMMAYENKEVGKYFASLFGIKFDSYDDGKRLEKVVTALSSGDEGKIARGYELLGEVAGAHTPSPSPWRVARDVNNIYRGLMEMPQIKSDAGGTGFLSGYFKGGLIDYMGLRPMGDAPIKTIKNKPRKAANPLRQN